MQKPTLHLGGTAAETLLEGYTEAQEAIREAIRKLERTAPHPRDYPANLESTESHRFAHAQAEHIHRVQALCRVREDLYWLGLHAAEDCQGNPQG